MPSPSSGADIAQGAADATAPKLAYYGDDFTGASDTLATLAQAGLRAILFCGVPLWHTALRSNALMRAECAQWRRYVPCCEQSSTIQ